MVNAKFQIYKDKAEKYRFRLRAPNNKIVTVGEAYESKAGCLKGVNAVKKYCRSEIEDITIAKMNEPPHLHEEIVLVLDEPQLRDLRKPIRLHHLRRPRHQTQTRALT